MYACMCVCRCMYNTENEVQAIHHFIATALFRMAKI